MHANTSKAVLTTLLLLAAPAVGLAMDKVIMIEESYARSSSPTAKTGAAFMLIANHSAQDDRLIAVTSDAAQRVELHTHLSDSEGVMRMVEIEDGIVVPAGGTAVLKRGHDHVMFMGLTEPFENGEMVPVTLTFEIAGDIEVMIPVDSDRKADGHGGHAGHTH